MENYAAYMDYTDHHVGRLIDSLQASGELDNTLVMYVVGDNGASAEGGLEGTFSEIASLLGVQLGLESTDQADRRDRRADERAARAGRLGLGDGRPVPVDQAGRQPLRRHSQPDGRALAQGDQGEGRDANSVPPRHRRRPDHPRGLQDPRAEGGQRHPAEADRRRVSMLYSFDDAKAKGRRTTQYFELATNRAIYHDGWVACSRYGVPWETAGRGDGFVNAPWELYNVEADFSQADDLAAKEPDKLKELQALFLEEAKKYDVFPLDPRFSERIDPKAPGGRRTEDELDLLRQQRPAARTDRSAALPAGPHHHRRADDPQGRSGGRDRLRRCVLGRLVALRQGWRSRRSGTPSSTSPT